MAALPTFRIHLCQERDGEMARVTHDIGAISPAHAKAAIRANPKFADAIVLKIKRLKS